MAIGGLSERRLEGEAMDDPAVDPLLHRAALMKLAQLNSLAGSARSVGRELEALGGNLRVLDLATGSGDLPLRLVQHGKRLGRRWQVDGADIAPLAIQVARENCANMPESSRPRYFQLDALQDPLPEGYDVLTCSLFVHHLSVDQATTLLMRMKRAAKRAVIVQDLLRSPGALRLTWLATRALSRNPLILEDGPASVAAAFTLEEARALAQRAGYEPSNVNPCWPYRWLLSERLR
jgi:2-polyprenyl-3-methyl-5-hydroxy-6-metoxy-1,4-benzoquinol methylase